MEMKKEKLLRGARTQVDSSLLDLAWNKIYIPKKDKGRSNRDLVFQILIWADEELFGSTTYVIM